MSTQTTTSTDVIAEFRTTFHRDFPYDVRYQSDNVILESSEGVRFHFKRQALIDDSTIFADASVLASDVDTPQPIVFTFAPTAGLHYFLVLLQRPPRPPTKLNEEPEPLPVTQSTTADAIRIAHILDAPAIGRAILYQGGLDIYLRYAIERSFEDVKPTMDNLKHPITRLRDPVDISFSLNLNDQYQRSLELMQEINPAAVKSLVKFHQHRQKALCAFEQWWSTGVPGGPVLRSEIPVEVGHNGDCRKRQIIENGGARFKNAYARFENPSARAVPRIVPAALIALAKSKSEKERKESLREILAGCASECKGCLARLEGIYMPALRSFNASFAASPK